MLLSFLSKILFHALGIIFNVELDDGCLKKVSKSQVLKMAIFGRNFKALAQVQFLTDFNKKYHFGLRRPRPFDLGLCKWNQKFRTHPNLHQ